MKNKIYSIYGNETLFNRIKDTAWEDRMSYSKKIEQIFIEYLTRREKEKTNEN